MNPTLRKFVRFLADEFHSESWSLSAQRATEFAHDDPLSSSSPSGNKTIATRRQPYAPSFMMTPASSIDAAVGAATWPVGAQV